MNDASRPAHAPALDGLRCLAFLCVFYHHSRSTPGIWGGIGVSAFFALSGFLITLGLERDDRPRRRVLLQFYARRSLRIFPLYYLTLVVLLIAGFLPYARWYFAYASNVLLSRLHAWEGPRTHFWTLAVEEQFYLIFPLLFLAVARRGRGVLVGALIAATIAARWAFDDGTGWNDNLLPVCGQYLLWGALAAVVLARAPRLASGGWFVAAGVLIVAAVYWPGTPVPTGTPDGIGFALIVLGLWTAPSLWVSRALALAPLVFLGRISYGLYVFHNLVIGEPFRWLRRPIWHYAWVREQTWIVNLAVTIVLATASWFLVERPILRLKRYFRAEPAGGAAAIAAAASALGATR